MDRFILRYCGTGARPAADVDRIRALPNITVIDDSSSGMLLVEAPEADLHSTLENMPGWVMGKEQTLRLPDPRPMPRKVP
jgi:hypothetical protein